MAIPGLVPTQAIPAEMCALVPTHTITPTDIVSIAQEATIQRGKSSTKAVSLGVLHSFLFVTQFRKLPGSMAAEAPLTEVFARERTPLLTTS